MGIRFEVRKDLRLELYGMLAAPWCATATSFFLLSVYISLSSSLFLYFSPCHSLLLSLFLSHSHHTFFVSQTIFPHFSRLLHRTRTDLMSETNFYDGNYELLNSLAFSTDMKHLYLMNIVDGELYVFFRDQGGKLSHTQTLAADLEDTSSGLKDPNLLDSIDIEVGPVSGNVYVGGRIKNDFVILMYQFDSATGRLSDAVMTSTGTTEFVYKFDTRVTVTPDEKFVTIHRTQMRVYYDDCAFGGEGYTAPSTVMHIAEVTDEFDNLAIVNSIDLGNVGLGDAIFFQEPSSGHIGFALSYTGFIEEYSCGNSHDAFLMTFNYYTHEEEGYSFHMDSREEYDCEREQAVVNDVICNKEVTAENGDSKLAYCETFGELYFFV